MSIADRREREKEELREQIVTAAMRLFLEQGYEKTSIRAIAQAIDYSPGTIYLYFKDKNDIFYEVHNRVFGHLLAAMHETARIEDPYERLLAIGRSYIRFAFENPESYELMFIMKAPMEGMAPTEEWFAGFQAHRYLCDTVQACVDAGLICTDPQVAAFLVWSAVHGMVSLALRQRLKMYPETDINAMIEQSSELLASMMRCK